MILLLIWLALIGGCLIAMLTGYIFTAIILFLAFSISVAYAFINNMDSVINALIKDIKMNMTIGGMNIAEYLFKNRMDDVIMKLITQGTISENTVIGRMKITEYVFRYKCEDIINLLFKEKQINLSEEIDGINVIAYYIKNNPNKYTIPLKLIKRMALANEILIDGKILFEFYIIDMRRRSGNNPYKYNIINILQSLISKENMFDIDKMIINEENIIEYAINNNMIEVAILAIPYFSDIRTLKINDIDALEYIIKNKLSDKLSDKLIGTMINNYKDINGANIQGENIFKYLINNKCSALNELDHLIINDAFIGDETILTYLILKNPECIDNNLMLNMLSIIDKPNKFDELPISTAVWYKNTRILRILLNNDAQINAIIRNKSLFVYSAYERYLNGAVLILNHTSARTSIQDIENTLFRDQISLFNYPVMNFMEEIKHSPIYNKLFDDEEVYDDFSMLSDDLKNLKTIKKYSNGSQSSYNEDSGDEMESFRTRTASDNRYYRYNWYNVITGLVEKGADIFSVIYAHDDEYMNLIQFALSINDINLIKNILKYNQYELVTDALKKTDKGGYTMIEITIAAENYRMALFLLNLIIAHSDNKRDYGSYGLSRQFIEYIREIKNRDQYIYAFYEKARRL